MQKKLRLRNKILNQLTSGNLKLPNGDLIENRPYQIQLVKKLGDLENLWQAIYLDADGGSGKTLMGYTYIQYSRHQGDALWLAPQDDMIEQASSDFDGFRQAGLVYESKIYSMTVQSVYALATQFCEYDDALEVIVTKIPNLNEAQQSLYNIISQCDKMVIDEIHLIGSGSDKYLKTLYYFFTVHCSGKIVLPISATLHDVVKNEPLGPVIGKVVGTQGSELEKQGYLNTTMLHRIVTGLNITYKKLNEEVNPTMDPEVEMILKEYGIDAIESEDEELTEIYQDLDHLAEGLKNKAIEILPKIRAMFKMANCKDLAGLYHTEWKGEIPALFYVPRSDTINSYDYAKETVDFLNNLFGKKIAYEYHGEIDKEIRKELKKKFKENNKDVKVLVCKDMLIESFSKNDLRLVFNGKMSHDPAQSRISQIFKRVRRVMRVNSKNIKEMSHGYYGVSAHNVFNKQIDTIDPTIFDKFHDMEGDWDDKLLELAKENALELQKLKYQLDHIGEKDAEHLHTLLEKALSQAKSIEQLGEDLQNGTLGVVIDTQTPMYTIESVNQGNAKDVFSADWYTFYPERRWSDQKITSMVNKLLEGVASV